MERQVVVLPRDRIVLLADAVTSSGAAMPTELRYRGLVPLAPSLDAEPADAPRHIDEARRLHPIPCAEGDVRPRLHPHCASVFLQIEKLARQRKRHGALDAQPLRFFRLGVEGTQSIQRQEWRAEGRRRGGFFHHEIPRNAHQDSRIQKFAARIEA